MYTGKKQATVSDRDGSAAEAGPPEAEEGQFNLESCEGSTAGIAAGIIKSSVDPGGWFDYDDKEVSAVPTNKLVSQYEG